MQYKIYNNKIYNNNNNKVIILLKLGLFMNNLNLKKVIIM